MFLITINPTPLTPKLSQMPKLKGGMAAKRARVIITDFGIKHGDPDAIAKVLSYKAPEFLKFLEEMPNFAEWSQFATKQKNMDRIIEFTCASLALAKEFEVIPCKSKT